MDCGDLRLKLHTVGAASFAVPHLLGLEGLLETCGLLNSRSQRTIVTEERDSTDVAHGIAFFFVSHAYCLSNPILYAGVTMHSGGVSFLISTLIPTTHSLYPYLKTPTPAAISLDIMDNTCVSENAMAR